MVIKGKVKANSEKVSPAEREDFFIRRTAEKWSGPIPLPEEWPDKNRYRVVKAGTGKIVVEFNEDDSVKRVLQPKDTDVLASIQRWSMTLSGSYNLPLRQAKDVYQNWLNHYPAIEEDAVRQVSWKSETGLTWLRLPWDIDEVRGQPMPTWDSILNRMHGAESFMAWVGSLFHPDSYSQQYVWLQGFGQDGKGSMIEYIGEIFGQAFHAANPPVGGDKFWNFQLLGRRLVAFCDIEDTKFVTSGRFKSLSGGDPISIEPKGLPQFTASIRAKYLFSSQNAPAVSSDIADQRRLIFCKFHTKSDAAVTGDRDVKFPEKLRAEGGAFLVRCLDTYRRLCPNHEAIPKVKIGDEGLTTGEMLSAENEEEFDRIFDNYFEEYRPEGRTDTQIRQQLYDMDPAKFSEVIIPAGVLVHVLKAELRGAQTKAAGEFREWIARKHNCNPSELNNKFSGNNKKYRGYIGARLRSENRLLVVQQAESIAGSDRARVFPG